MKITLKSKLGVFGDKKQVEVGRRLGIGLINRGQATKGWKTEVTNKDTLEDKTVKELQEIAKEKGVSYAGLRKADLIKELKEDIDTKEDKTEYQTK
jgi:hypothetical protein